MDRIFDRLGDLLRSVIQDDGRTARRSAGADPRFRDPDMEEAWDELNEFLNEGGGEPKTGTRQTGRRSTTSGPSTAKPSGPPVELARDYSLLGIRFGASFEEVRKAHKRLLIRNHPDRFSANTDQQKAATETTQRINQSFQRIKKFHETGKM